jgi:pimeloyl-ACP methyl ester carboxylesterase
LELIDDLEGAARRHATPCHDGDLIWREWGAGPTVVLHHGGFGSWLHWIRNIAHLAASHRVLAVDTPGLGDSAQVPEPVTPETIARPIAEGLETLLAADEACDLVGFSFGGLVAGQVAVQLGARVRSLTLVGSSGLGLPRGRIDLVRRTPDMSAQELREAQKHNIRALMLHHPESVDELAMAIQAHNDLRARVKSRRLSLGESLREALPALQGQLNGIWGEHDVTGLPGLVAHRELLSSITPDMAFRVIPDAGHWVQYEAAQAFNETLESLLDR